MSVAAARHLVSLLRSSSASNFPTARHLLHAHLTKFGLLSCSRLRASLLDSYCKHAALNEAHRLFDEMPNRDCFLYSSLLSAYSNSPQPQRVLPLFRAMVLSDGVLPDDFIVATLVRTATCLGSVRLGRQAHAFFCVSSSSDDVVKSSLVDMYSKCCLPDDARRVFESISCKNHVSWTAMIAGYSSNGRWMDALELLNAMPEKGLITLTALISGLVRCGESFRAIEVFVQMRQQGIRVGDPFLLPCVVGAAADLAALEMGKQMHALVLVTGYELSMVVCNALMDMYAKCTDILAARAVFEKLVVRDTVSWTTIVVGEAQHGRAEEALAIFKDMVDAGVRPNEVTFVGILYACSHAGMVDKGRLVFDSMTRDYGIRPSLQHYTCFLDLLSRSGHLREAEAVIDSMPCLPDEAMWAALLSACKKHKDAEMSIKVADRLLRFGPKDPSTFVLLSNTYAAARKWDSVAGMRVVMNELGFKKEPGYSRVDFGPSSFTFTAGELPPEGREEILGFLGELTEEMKKKGYVPDTSCVVHDMEEQEKEQQLLLHSERLAVAFGLLRSVAGTVIRVVKNLRVCEDCHEVMKMISSITEREIVVRDANRFHHFKAGRCSCGGFW